MHNVDAQQSADKCIKILSSEAYGVRNCHSNTSSDPDLVLFTKKYVQFHEGKHAISGNTAGATSVTQILCRLQRNMSSVGHRWKHAIQGIVVIAC